MKQIIIEGGTPLTGNIAISGAKNSVVALIPIALLAPSHALIKNVPNISDTVSLLEMLKLLNCHITYENETLNIDTTEVKNTFIPGELSKRLRASYYLMGTLLAKYNYVEMSIPGGCNIGLRPIDLHLDGFKSLGATITTTDDKITIETTGLIGTDINLRIPSVGATINLMIAATSAQGITHINNAAKEPEIINIAEFLNNLGANITGAGTDTITITGKTNYQNGEISVIPDRIEAGTYILAGALMGNNLTISGIKKENLTSLFRVLDEMQVDYALQDTSLTITKKDIYNPVNVTTTFYPGFPTDLAQPLAAVLTKCNGTSTVTETIWENRLGHVPYLVKMNANISVESKEKISVHGPTNFLSKEVEASDLRAGASLVIAALTAEGTTTIDAAEHILRGYENIVEKLSGVGAKIKVNEIE